MLFNLCVVGLGVIIVVIAFVCAVTEADKHSSWWCPAILGASVLLFTASFADSWWEDYNTPTPAQVQLQQCNKQRIEMRKIIKAQSSKLQVTKDAEAKAVRVHNAAMIAKAKKVFDDAKATPKAKPMGTQAEYRVVFDEDLAATVPNPQWAFQKFYKGEWTTIVRQSDKAELEAYAQDYVNKVQAPSKVITVKKVMQPVLSDSTVESISAVEAQ